LVNLILFVIVLFVTLMMDFSLFVLSSKLFINNFFGDFELVLNLWRLLFL